MRAVFTVSIAGLWLATACTPLDCPAWTRNENGLCVQMGDPDADVAVPSDASAPDGADAGESCQLDETCTTPCGTTGRLVADSSCDPESASCMPPAETCNGQDDDCDGSADEDFECVAGQFSPCTTACGSTGTGRCSQDCTPATGDTCSAPAESCNFTDDDCDGVVDEGLTQAGAVRRIEGGTATETGFQVKLLPREDGHLLVYSGLEGTPEDGTATLYAQKLGLDGSLQGESVTLVKGTYAFDAAIQGASLFVVELDRSGAMTANQYSLTNLKPATADNLGTGWQPPVSISVRDRAVGPPVLAVVAKRDARLSLRVLSAAANGYAESGSAQLPEDATEPRIAAGSCRDAWYLGYQTPSGSEVGVMNDKGTWGFAPVEVNGALMDLASPASCPAADGTELIAATWTDKGTLQRLRQRAGAPRLEVTSTVAVEDSDLTSTGTTLVLAQDGGRWFMAGADASDPPVLELAVFDTPSSSPRLLDLGHGASGTAPSDAIGHSVSAGASGGHLLTAFASGDPGVQTRIVPLSCP